MMVMRIVIRERIWIIEWIVWVCVIASSPWSVTAFRRHYSILRKSDPTNRIGIDKMVFPDLNTSPFHSPLSDEACTSPQSDHFFFRHVSSDIRDVTRVAGGE